MSSCYQSCIVLLRKICGLKISEFLFIGIGFISLGSLLLRRTPRELLGSRLTVISIPGGWRKYGHANGRITRSWKRLESCKSLHNMLLMPASPTSSQLNVNSIISSQTSLFTVLLSFLGIILLRCSLIYMLKPIDTSHHIYFSKLFCPCFGL